MEPDNWTLVHGAKQLLTLHTSRGQRGRRRGAELQDLGLIIDGSVLIHNGEIKSVGPTRRVENIVEARKAREIDAAGRVVMPAFIDAHACIVPAPAYGRDEPAKAVQALPATRLEAQADELLQILARHGTATVAGLSGYGSDSAGELKILRALQGRDRKPIDIISILRIMRAPQTNETKELIDAVFRRKLAGIVAVHSGEHGLSANTAESLMGRARSAGFSVRVEMTQKHDPQLVEAALGHGALSVSAPGPYRAAEIELLSNSQTAVVLVPQLLARAGVPGSSRDLINSGALVALGTGLRPEPGVTASMQTVIQLACDLLEMSLPEAVCAATLNAACALGVGSRTGSLEHGKWADMVLLNASDYHEILLLAGTNLIHSMVKRGVVLFKEDFPGWPPQD